VDDEESVRSIARRMLEHLGFNVLTAADGRDAVEVYRREADRIRLVLLDMTMPHLDGEKTFRELRTIRADVRVILSSGYDHQTATSRFAGPGLAGFIQKPYRFETLEAEIRKVLEAMDREQ
jgi:DNA-binding NtrC family response regulator